jgi:hypothetical protein
MLLAYVDGRVVRVPQGISCSCGRQVQPYDIRFDPGRDGAFTFICTCGEDGISSEGAT